MDINNGSMDINPLLARHPLFLVGYMGAGKSTVGRKLARLIKADFIDTDIYIENRFRKKVAQIFDEEGEEVFRNREAMVLQELTGYCNAIISTGGGMACHHGNMDAMLQSGVVIYLRYSAEELAHRLSEVSRGRPLLKGLRGEELVQYVRQSLTQREPYYLRANLLVDCSVVCPTGDENDLAQYIFTLLHDPLFLQEFQKRFGEGNSLGSAVDDEE